ncbi:golgi apparatus membrane protein TVP23 [Babesia caballi]|uniref:Golgi apparatus membrane protein TVP23 homolog n=1 Tax=Babesia caballi TaxID=5871 RepID=A0AAV4M3D0_BABCB|nr:golgi apparatus membrane protein TVP23 [Babesia caballi]
MADELTGTINDGGNADSSSTLYNNFLTNVKLLPHPFACLAHIAFKAAIIVAYFMMPYIFGWLTGASPDYIFTFELIALLSVADFWVVKHCTSRYGVGARFELLQDEMFLHKEETHFFWVVMYAWPVMWALNILFKLSTFDIPSTVISGLIFALGAVNLYNCTRCSQGKGRERDGHCFVEKPAKVSRLSGLISGELKAKLASKVLGFVAKASQNALLGEFSERRLVIGGVDGCEPDAIVQVLLTVLLETGDATSGQVAGKARSFAVFDSAASRFREALQAAGARHRQTAFRQSSAEFLAKEIRVLRISLANVFHRDLSHTEPSSVKPLQRFIVDVLHTKTQGIDFLCSA